MTQRVISFCLSLFLALVNGASGLDGSIYTVHSRIPIYQDSLSAAAGINVVGAYDPGNYYLYESADGMHNISRTVNAPGHWINPMENRAVIGIWQTIEDVDYRTGPSTAYPGIAMLSKGTQVELIARTSSTWYEVRVNGTTGFITASKLVEISASDPSVAPVYLETTGNGDFLTGPSNTDAPIQYLLAGTKVELVSRSSATWYEVRYAGRVGYISADNLKVSVEPSVVEVPEDAAEPTEEVVSKPYVTTTSVNFRTGPSSAYPLIHKLDIGTTLSYVSAVKDGWVQVVHSGQRGFVPGDSITPLVLQQPLAEPVTVTANTRTHVVNARADVRTGPGTSYTWITQLDPGAMVGVASINNSWARISFYMGKTLKTGYVNTSFISPQATTQGGIPKIGIAYNRHDLKHYIEAINRAGGKAVLLPEATSETHARELAASVSGLVFAGGRSTTTSDRLMIQAALNADKPTLGICLGFQLINRTSGGTIVDLVRKDFDRSQIHRDPDIKAFRYHPINIKADSMLARLVGTGTDTVNSFHRFRVGTLGDNLDVLATSPDGAVEGIQRNDKTFVVGIASHPERMYTDGNTIYHSIFIELISQARQAAAPVTE